MTVSIIAGLATYWVVGFVIHVVLNQSLAESMYFRVFGLAPFLAHFFDRSYYFGEGPRLSDSVIGDRVYLTVFIGFWTLLFGALYFFFVFRARHRTDQAEQ
jgi:hypothetical protein